MSLYTNAGGHASGSSLVSLAQPPKLASESTERTGSPRPNSNPQDKSGFTYLASVADNDLKKGSEHDARENKSPQYTHEPAGSQAKFQLSPDFKYPAKSAETDSADKPSKDAKEEGEDVAMLDAPHQEQQRSHKQGVHFLISEPASHASSPR